MSARYSQKANLLAGTFLLGSVFLAVAISFVLADISLTRHAEYTIRFSLKDGATGLSPDASVRVGGQQVGKVQSIHVEHDEAIDDYAIHVIIKIRADIELYEDAWAHLEVPLLGTGSTINIPYLGTGKDIKSPQGTSTRLEPGEMLIGSIAPPIFLANAGFGPQQREQFQRMLTDTERALAQFADALEAIRPNVQPVADDAAATVAAARRSMESLETDLADWRTNVTTTLDNAAVASDRLPAMVDDANIILADAGEIIKTGRAVVDDNRPRIDNILANTDTITARLNEEWIPRGSDLLDSARTGIQTYTDAGARINTLIAEQQPGLERTLANLRVASDQFKFLAIEARSQPWRLLHRPDTKELENQLLYDSARSYAVAVADLRAASESMESIIARTGLTGQLDLDQLQAMRAKLQQAFEGYATAESDLLDRMIDANE